MKKFFICVACLLVSSVAFGQWVLDVPIKKNLNSADGVSYSVTNSGVNAFYVNRVFLSAVSTNVITISRISTVDQKLVTNSYSVATAADNSVITPTAFVIYKDDILKISFLDLVITNLVTIEKYREAVGGF